MSANSVSALAYRAREGLRQAFLTAHLADTSVHECRWVTEHLGGYVRKGLSKRDATKVSDHLEECRRCTAMYLELTEVNGNLSAIIAPLLLGAAATGYLASTGGLLGGVVVLLDRAKDLVVAHTASVAATTVAAGVATATVVTVAITGGGGGNIPLARPEPSAIVSSIPVPPSSPVETPAPSPTKDIAPTFPVIEVPPITSQPTADISITSSTISDNALVLNLAGLPEERVVINVDMSSTSGHTTFRPAQDMCTVTDAQPRHAECVAGTAGATSAWQLAPQELELVIPLQFPEDMTSDQLYFVVSIDGYADPNGADNTAYFNFTPSETPSPTPTPTPSGSPSPTESPTESPTPTEPPATGDLALDLAVLDDHQVKATVTGLPLITLDLAFNVTSEHARLTQVPFGCLMVSDTSASCLLTVSTGTFEGVFTFDYPPGQAPVDITMTISALLVEDDNTDNNTDSVEIGEHPGNGGEDGEEPQSLLAPLLSLAPLDLTTDSEAHHSQRHADQKGDQSARGDEGPVTETETQEEGGLLSIVSGLLGGLL
jgi:hypothetical protein